MRIELNAEQNQLSRILADWLYNSSSGYFGVLGAGGTGKTTVVCNVLSNYNNSVVFLGATNKVTSVIKDSLANNGVFNAKIKTIDSYLGFRIFKDHENKSTIMYRLPSIKKLPKLIVIDEVSMITLQKFEQIDKLSSYCKILLLGDHLQIPPIEDKENVIRDNRGFKVSKIFTRLNQNNSFTLTIQNRQKSDSELGKLIHGFRTHMDKEIPALKIAKVKSNGADILFFKTNDKELKEIIKNENPIAVCYKNLTVLSLNWLIGSTKSMKKDYRLNEINVGDTLMFDQFYVHGKTNFYTSNVVTVLEIEKNVTEIFYIKKTIKKTIVYNKLIVSDDQDKVHTIRYVHGGLYGKNGGGVSQSVYGQRRTYLEHIRQNKNTEENKEFLSDLNTRFANYQNSFAKLKKPYAITSHKAQGSTYKNVIIPAYDYYGLDFKDVNQLLYVAMSRAKEKIIFIDKNEQFDSTSKRKHFTEFEKQAIASTYDYKCANCKKNLLEREFDIDHKIPLANGGKNEVENLQPLCKNCHKDKSASEKYL